MCFWLSSTHDGGASYRAARPPPLHGRACQRRLQHTADLKHYLAWRLNKGIVVLDLTFNHSLTL